MREIEFLFATDGFTVKQIEGIKYSKESRKDLIYAHGVLISKDDDIQDAICEELITYNVFSYRESNWRCNYMPWNESFMYVMGFQTEFSKN